MDKKFWNIPNVLSLIRLALVPIMLLCFFLIPGEDHLAAMIVFLVASLTDVLDGFIARKTNQITQYGIVLDPLADKLLKISALVAFCIVGILPIWLVSVLIFIDVAMIIAGAVLYKEKITIPSNFFGKAGTMIMSVGLLLSFFAGSLSPWNLYVLYCGLIMIVVSVIVYTALNYKRVFSRKSKTQEELVVETTATPVNVENQEEDIQAETNEDIDDKKE